MHDLFALPLRGLRAGLSFVINLLRRIGLMSTPPVNAAEVIFRQIGPGGTPIYFDPNRSPPLHFAPLPARVKRFGRTVADSISFSHGNLVGISRGSSGRSLSPCTRCCRESRRNSPRQRHRSVEVSTQVPMRLDVQNGSPWAHCVAREINRTQYDADNVAKRRMKEWALAMADHIQPAEIIGPFQRPTQADPYRV